MAKRKYTRFGEKAQGYQCAKRKCKWQGFDSEKIQILNKVGINVLVCPKCLNDTFLGLIYYKKTI